MKVFGIIVKIVAAIAAIIGVGYVIATYGNKIVDWTKKLFSKNNDQICEVECECTCESECEECACEEAAACEAEPAQDVVEEADFEG